MKQPLDHIERPRLPWREGPTITECGLDASKVTTLTRDEYFERLKDMGQQRSALLTCMTCGDTARRWATWDVDPRRALEREIVWEAGYYRRVERQFKLLDELRAIASLIDKHRDEFAGLIAQHEQRRDWLDKKAAHHATKRKTHR